MEDASKKRKERLEALRKRKLASVANGDDTKASLTFRNYTPINEDLKAESDVKAAVPRAPEGVDTVEKQTEGVVETVIQEEEKKRTQDVDIFSLAPMQPNWDLKRDIEPRLKKLEKRTRAAIVELIRKEKPDNLIMAD
ncbi:hypothetical protein BGW42_007707 [Actinomortierella wolfii]|nr:hypothetical protein BGW41_002888 [Actinomortierella wolfii]KAG0233119.1 hypothetical protein BGW42_007707 [Actinomortierella wolfii]